MGVKSSRLGSSWLGFGGWDQALTDEYGCQQASQQKGRDPPSRLRWRGASSGGLQRRTVWAVPRGVSWPGSTAGRVEADKAWVSERLRETVMMLIASGMFGLCRHEQIHSRVIACPWHHGLSLDTRRLQRPQPGLEEAPVGCPLEAFQAPADRPSRAVSAARVEPRGQATGVEVAGTGQPGADRSVV